MMRKAVAAILCLLAVAGMLLLPGCSGERPQSMEWTTGQVGGGWYTMAAGLAKFIHRDNPGLSLKVVPGGGTVNATKIQAGRSQLGWGLDALTYQAVAGTALYEGNPHPDVTMIGMSFSDIYTHFLRAGDAEYRSIEDIFTIAEDINIGVTKAGSSDERVFSWLMEFHETSYEELRRRRGFKINHGNIFELSSQFKDGQVDYLFINQGVPAAAVIDMSQSREFELLPFSDAMLEVLRDTYGLGRGFIAAGAYAADQDDIQTIKMETALLVHRRMPDHTVYGITRSLCENQENLVAVHGSAAVFDCTLDPETAPADVHPGALRYYGEEGRHSGGDASGDAGGAHFAEQ